ncbi:DUF4118 domain-containing protein [Dactylosporangium sp. NPDC000244]|uniref:sensor histidine kinase n=1 Tax=Dactylosporangium sp. NPDC000244 TaxID=3154365 RepID=UPI003319C870
MTGSAATGASPRPAQQRRIGTTTPRGRLRIYLGAAPGVGKTYAMLAEGQRRRSRGTDVVIGFIEPHGRRLTAAMADGLELVPRREVVYRGARLTEMDLDAVLARHPQVALIDELAHTNAPGCRNAKRWQDVEELLNRGVDVVTTLNIQHLESLNDVVRQITGITQHETLPDSVARRAEQVELVDMTPEALRRRMVHGNVYPPDRIEAALTHYFRPGNLAALRELALLWVADRVEECLQRYRAEHGIATGWETRERILVALSGGREGETLIRRAARIAERIQGAELLTVHVIPSGGLTLGSQPALAAQRVLAESLGGHYHQVVGDDVARAILQFAQAENATQIVLGASRTPWPMSALTGEGVGARVIRLSGPIDVHMVTHEHAAVAPGLRLPRAGRGRGARQYLAAVVLSVLLLSAVTLAGLQTRFTHSSVLLGYLLPVIVAALTGGLYPATATALAAALLADYWFMPPQHAMLLTRPDDIAALVLFVAVATILGWAIDTATRQTRRAVRASAEAAALSSLARAALGEPNLPAQVERIRRLFALDAVSLLGRESTSTSRRPWQVLASAGDRPPELPDEADTSVPAGQSLALAGRGRVLGDNDQRVLVACAAQLAACRDRQRLAAHVASADQQIAADRARTTMLLATERELQEPLTLVRDTLDRLATDDPLSVRQRQDRTAAGRAGLDRIAGVLTDLRHLAQANAGALDIHLRPVELDEVLSVALEDLGPGGRDIAVDAPEDMPDVIADANLLTRVITSLATDVLRRTPRPAQATLSVHVLPDGLAIDVTGDDRRPPAVDERHTRATPRTIGVDAVRSIPMDTARALTEAMGGTLRHHVAPGGALTVSLTLPTAATS